MRSYCQRCQYPVQTCVCQWVSPVATPVNIIVLQHKKEVYHAKNTVRLAQLCIPSIQIRIIDKDTPISKVYDTIDLDNAALIYPSASAISLNDEPSAFVANHYQSIVFLDGTWKQASGMYHSLFANKSIDCWSVQSEQASSYAIRSTNVKNALSTLESLAAVLSQGYRVDTKPLYQLQAKWQTHWQRAHQ